MRPEAASAILTVILVALVIGQFTYYNDVAQKIIGAVMIAIYIVAFILTRREIKNDDKKITL